MDELRAGDPVTVGGVTIVPVERRVLRTCAGDGRCWLSGRKEAAAILVRDATGIRAFDVDAGEVAVESLLRDAPDLRPWLASPPLGMRSSSGERPAVVRPALWTRR